MSLRAKCIDGGKTNVELNSPKLIGIGIEMSNRDLADKTRPSLLWGRNSFHRSDRIVLAGLLDAESATALATSIFSLSLRASLPGAVTVTWCVPRALKHSARGPLCRPLP